MPPLDDPEQEPLCSRTRRAIRRLMVGDEARPRQRFVPVDKLRSHLTREKVTELLECRCNGCQREHQVFRRDRTPAEFINRIVGLENDPSSQRDPAKTALSLFALLIYIGHPLLIIGFVMRRCTDHALETTSALFSSEHLRKEYCSEFAKRVGVETFQDFASAFAEALPTFAIPRMDSGEYSVYGPDTILPFLNERKIGIRGPDGSITQEGAYGKVYAFDIYEEYRQFPHAKEVRNFARKELDSTSELAFHLENKNLEQAITLQHPHIVKMIKAYRHGDTFNLIFPRARTNLDHLLRDPAFEFGNSVQGPVESRSVWAQVFGITTALGKIGGTDGTEGIFGPSDKPQFQGVHFDLKPANILVDDKGNWLISDFGQSTFRETTRSSSRVINQGGTDAYAPPEIDNLDARFSRRYDVWSLGCIILEVLTFTLLGHDGLCGSGGLDQVRFTKAPWSSRSDHRFFCQEFRQGKYIIKPEIIGFMKHLAKSACLRGQQKSRVFVESLLELISKMLDPEAEHRIDVGNVIRLLKSAMDTAQDDSQTPGQMVAMPNERPIGEPGLSKLENVWHWRQNDWDSTRLGIFADPSSNLRICTVLKNNSSPSENYLIRNTTFLVPRYAFRSRFTADPAIYFSHFNLDGPQKFPGSIFSFDNEQDAWFVQAALIGQRVEASFTVKNINLQEWTSFGDRVARLIHRKSRKEGDHENLGTGTVQLWSEVVEEQQPKETMKPRQNSTVTVKTSSTRGPRVPLNLQAGYREVAPRRMVIFIHDSRKIILIKMSRNWHAAKPEQGEPPELLHFSQTNSARDPSFTASTLRPLQPSDDNSFPGIPLSQNLFRSIESENEFECDSISLTLRSAELRKKFSDTYRDLKEEWYKETKFAEKQPGYTPTTYQQRREYPAASQQLANVSTKTSSTSSSSSSGRTNSWNPLRSPTGLSGILPGSTPAPLGNGLKHGAHRGGGRGGSRGVIKEEEIPSQSTAMNGRYG